MVDSAVVFYYYYWLPYFLFRGIALWGGKDFHQLQKFAHQGVQIRFQEITAMVGKYGSAYKSIRYLEGPITFFKKYAIFSPSSYFIQ